MNFKSIYSSATTPEDIKEQQQVELLKKQADKDFASGITAQQRSEWVSLLATQSLLKELSVQIDDIESTARNLALGTEQTQQVIKSLIVAETLRKILKYVRTGN